MLSPLLSTLALGLLLLPFTVAAPADAAAAKPKCPETFAIYLGVPKSNPPDNRKYYLRTRGNGAGVRLSVPPTGATAFRLNGTAVVEALAPSIELLGAANSQSTFVRSADEAYRKQYAVDHNGLVEPEVVAKLDRATCVLKLSSANGQKKYAVSAGVLFGLGTAEQREAANLVWPDPTAVPVPARGPPLACEQAYLDEPCPIN